MAGCGISELAGTARQETISEHNLYVAKRAGVHRLRKTRSASLTDNKYHIIDP